MNIDPMAVTLFFCSECREVSTETAWQHGWVMERLRRRHDPEYSEEENGQDFGLDDRMVCPRCQYVHADDDMSFVHELKGIAVFDPAPIEEYLHDT